MSHLPSSPLPPCFPQRLQRLQPPGAKVGGVLYNMVSSTAICSSAVPGGHTPVLLILPPSAGFSCWGPKCAPCPPCRR